MWCDLSEEERENCDGRCVVFYIGKFPTCEHWHEGETDGGLSRFVSRLDKHCGYKDIIE